MEGSTLKKRFGLLVLAAVALFSLFGLLSCRSFTPSQASLRQLSNTPEPKIVIERFFLYYIRGVWRSIRGRWEGAASDFKTSMRKDKHGSNQDRRWIYTYGMHRLFDFFPNRELGICNFRLHKYLEARHYLRTSHSQEPSERARHYLELTNRQILLERIDRGEEIPAPIHLEIDGFEANGHFLAAGKTIYLPSTDVKLVGRVKSLHGIRTVEVNQQKLYLPQMDNGEFLQEFPLSFPLELSSGKNEMIVHALSQTNTSATQHHILIVDGKHPRVHFSPVGVASPGFDGTKDVLQMVVSDDVGLESVFIDGIEAEIKFGSTQFIYRLQPIGSEVSIKAQDLAGNTTKVSLPMSCLLELSRTCQEHNPQLLYASAKEIPFRPKKPDEARPELRLHPPIPARHVVNGSGFVLDFEARDGGGLGSIEVQLNDYTERLDLGSAPILHLRRPSRLNLVEGENQLSLRAWDAEGNQQQYKYTIVSQPAADSRCDIRLGVKIIPPTLNSMRAREQERAANDRRMPKNFNVFGWFTHGLINQFPPRLLIFNQEPEALQAIREERWFARFAKGYEKLCSGQKDVVDWIFTGYYTPWSGKDNWDVTITVTDRRSRQTVMVQNMHFTSFDQQEIKTRMRWLGHKFRQTLPIHKRPFLDQKDRQIEIDLGKQHGMRAGMHFAFLPDNNEFGNPRRTTNNELVIAVITEVNDLLSKAKIYPAQGKKNVSAKDLVVVR